MKEKAQFVETRLGKLKKAMDVELGTETAKKIWKERIEFYTELYEKLRAQLNSSTKIIQ
ncbi:MAG: hypothetical protein IJK13_03795 [Lachnospiraceae bacterium]|nr:hypothetical protein [Lachnospiraceae bacterium]